MEDQGFVPAEFGVPATLETNRFRLRMLSVDDVEADYAAVIESRALLHSMGSSWPREGFTIEENLVDLARHEREFLKREAFAYTVVALDESRVLGCVYINPVEGEHGAAAVHLWVRQTEFDQGLDPVLYQAVRDWMSASWPFKNVIYPDRQ